MHKNLVFIIAVKKDGQLKPEYEIGIESWRRWCKKNDTQMFLLEEPVLPMEDMHIIWQRYFLFDIYDANEIKANQTLMVDADTIIHPDCPNFFNETENKYCLVHDDGSYDWVLRGMEHYKKRVYDKDGKNYRLWWNYWEYGNSGFQIVNGGQTTATLFRTKKQNNRVNFSNVVVPAKITLVKKEILSQVVPKISEYANTQNVVKKADFSSSHPFHLSIKNLSNKIRTSEGHQWFYERMRGEYQMQKMKQKDLGKNKKSKYLEVSPSNMKFTKEDLAKFINCWHYLDPHVACTGAQKSFVTFMNSLNDKKFHEKLDDDFFRKYCSISILFNKTTKVIKDNNDISGYRSQLLNYTISLLSYHTSRKINFDIIWADQNISSQLQEIIKSWSFKIYEIIQKTAKGKNISEWCKKEECWEDIMDRSFTFTNTPPEFTNLKKVAGKPIRIAKEIFSPEDMDNIKKCKSLSTRDWEKMIAWAQESDEFHYVQLQIATSLWMQSLSNWKRQPSPKQAKSALKIIEKAEEAEII